MLFRWGHLFGGGLAHWQLKDLYLTILGRPICGQVTLVINLPINWIPVMKWQHSGFTGNGASRTALCGQLFNICDCVLLTAVYLIKILYPHLFLCGITPSSLSFEMFHMRGNSSKITTRGLIYRFNPRNRRTDCRVRHIDQITPLFLFL